MKFSLLSLLALTLLLNACTTLSNRRDLYSPDKRHGRYTDAVNQYHEEKTWATESRPTAHPPEQRPNETPVGYPQGLHTWR